jgi:putative lipoprotein
MTTRLLPLLLLSFLSLAHADGERIRYACDNGSRLDISFRADGDGRPQATLHFADGEIVLPGVPAASGALYRAGDIRLHTKGDDARVEDGRGNTRNCTRGDVPAPAAAAEPAGAGSFLDITGSVTYLARSALPPDAVLIVRIQDTSRADAPARTLSEQRIELAGAAVPIPFRATVDRDLIGKRARITVSARIERGGKLLFINDTSYPAMVDGQPRHVDMTLKPVGAARKR